MSLLPFTTAWIAQTRLAAGPVVLYAALCVCADGTYNVFERLVLRESGEVTAEQRRIARYRSKLAFVIFTSAAILAGFVPWAGFGLICLALVLHLKPDVGVPRPLRRGGRALKDPSPDAAGRDERATLRRAAISRSVPEDVTGLILYLGDRVSGQRTPAGNRN